MFVFSNVAHAQPKLAFPLSCDLGQDCFVVNYVDADPSDKAADFTCGPRTYNDHQGTDIGLIDRVAMEKGVDVLAAADGTVLRVRDEIEDKEPTAAEMAAMLAENKGCGNGVLVDHGAGWQTIYCHLKQGSVVVKPSQTVKAGDKIAQAGQSGAAEFPHLHLGVFFESHTVDPFTGINKQDGCGGFPHPLWNKEIAYSPVFLYAAGFKDHAPDFEAIKIDAASPGTLSPNAEALVFWGGLYGAAEGDQIHIEVTDPVGALFASRDITQDGTRARQFYYVGRKRSEDSFIPGEYVGTLTWTRVDQTGNPLVRSLRKAIDVR
ncbi:MAG: M23 family metallopeptidase [Rhodospirillales bacterium]|nr:M23 family metallopeptidase [Rhodospirillales bacterium]